MVYRKKVFHEGFKKVFRLEGKVAGVRDVSESEPSL